MLKNIKLIVVFLLFLTMNICAMEKINKEAAKRQIYEKLENLDKEQNEIIKTIYESFRLCERPFTDNDIDDDSIIIKQYSDRYHWESKLQEFLERNRKKYEITIKGKKMLTREVVTTAHILEFHKNKERLRELEEVNQNWKNKKRTEESNITNILEDFDTGNIHFSEEEKAVIQQKIDCLQAVALDCDEKIHTLTNANDCVSLQNILEGEKKFKIMNELEKKENNSNPGKYVDMIQKYVEGKKRYDEYEFTINDPNVETIKYKISKTTLGLNPLFVSSISSPNNEDNRSNSYFWSAMTFTGCISCLVLAAILAAWSSN